MANTPFDDIGSNEILSTQISGIQDAVKNVEQSLDMGTEVIANEPLTLLADVIGAKRIAEAIGKRNWLKDPAPVIQQNISTVWTTISTGFTIDYAGGAIVFAVDKTGEQYRASFTRVKNTSGYNTHLSNYVLQVPYGVTTGSADTYAVTLDPAPASYVDGMALAVKINVNNTGASTINVNSLGAKPIKKPNGNDVSAGNLKTGSIYSMRYNGTNFILQGSDAAGDATTADVLSGKTFSNDADTGLTGVMPDRGTVNITPSTVNQTILAGKHSGSGVVSGSANLVAGNILKDVNIFNVIGNVPAPPVLTEHASTIATPTAATTRNYTGTTPTKLKEIRVDYAGSIRAYWEYQKVGGTGFTNIALYKNGVEVAGTIHTFSTSGSWQNNTLGGINVVAGDLIQVYGWGTDASTESACRLLELRYTTNFIPHAVTLS